MEQLATSDAGGLARDVLAMSPEEFAATFQHTSLSRAKLSGLKRNACCILGSAGTGEGVADPV